MKVLVNMYRCPKAQVVTQYVGVDLPAPKDSILMNSDMQLELIGNDQARLLPLGQIIEGFRISLSQETLRTLL